MTDPTRHALVRAAYDEWSATYDVDRNATRDLDAVVLRQQVLPLRGADVLEVGCGTGKNTEWLSQTARSVVAVDVSRGMLRRARLRVTAPNVSFVLLDLTSPWSVRRSSFGVVVVNLVLEHVEDLPAFFVRAAEALRPGGTLFVSELHPEKQRRGSQARFTRPGGETVPVPAWPHLLSDFKDAGRRAEFMLQTTEEHFSAPDDGCPRLLTMSWRRGDPVSSGR